MIYNIIDHRERPYRWRKVNAIVEAVEHDNDNEDADQFEEPNDDALMYDRRVGLSLHEAVMWAEEMPGAVTLFIYDKGTVLG